jgi:predicted phage tail protein
VQDAPRSASHLFAPGNVADGKFSYAGTSARQRHSVAIVYWNNPAEHFERVPEVVVDDALVAKLGIREIELSPLGVTSRGQANRVGRWLLYSEANESQTVSFRTSFEGAALTLGDVFKVTDPTEAGDRLGGRIKSATASAVTLDAPVTLVAGESYTLSVMWPDAAQPLGYITEERSVSTAAGVASTLTVAPAFSQAPAAQSMWLLASNTVQPTLWRCVALDEVEAGIYEVTGSAYDPGKFAAVEQGVKLEPRPISRLRERPVPPTGLTATETVYTAGVGQ